MFGARNILGRGTLVTVLQDGHPLIDGNEMAVRAVSDHSIRRLIGNPLAAEPAVNCEGHLYPQNPHI